MESLNIVDYANSSSVNGVAEAVAATAETKHDATVSQSEHVETLSIATGTAFPCWLNRACSAFSKVQPSADGQGCNIPVLGFVQDNALFCHLSDAVLCHQLGFASCFGLLFTDLYTFLQECSSFP